MIKVKIIEIEGTPEEVAEYQKHLDALKETHIKKEEKQPEKAKQESKITYQLNDRNGVIDFLETPKLKEGSLLKDVLKYIASEGSISSSKLCKELKIDAQKNGPFRINGLMTGITRRCQKKMVNKNAALIKSKKSADGNDQIYWLYDFETKKNVHEQNLKALKAYFQN